MFCCSTIYTYTQKACIAYDIYCCVSISLLVCCVSDDIHSLFILTLQHHHSSISLRSISALVGSTGSNCLGFLFMRLFPQLLLNKFGYAFTNATTSSTASSATSSTRLTLHVAFAVDSVFGFGASTISSGTRIAGVASA